MATVVTSTTNAMTTRRHPWRAGDSSLCASLTPLWSSLSTPSAPRSPARRQRARSPLLHEQWLGHLGDRSLLVGQHAGAEAQPVLGQLGAAVQVHPLADRFAQQGGGHPRGD